MHIHGNINKMSTAIGLWVIFILFLMYICIFQISYNANVLLIVRKRKLKTMRSPKLRNNITSACSLNTETHVIQLNTFCSLLLASTNRYLFMKSVVPESLSSSALQHLLACQGHSISKMVTHATTWTQLLFLLTLPPTYWRHPLQLLHSGSCYLC